jgi:hypothetical protein
MQIDPWRKGYANRIAIINAVKSLGVCAPSQISDFIDNKIRQKWRLLGIQDKREIELHVKREKVKERTLFGWLKALTNQGILNHSDNRYSLTDRVKSDDRYFPELVGDSIISQLMLIHRPTLYPIKHNIRQLVESLGFYIVWSFIHGARPIYNESLSGKNKDEIVTNWLNKAINPLNTFEYFLAAIKNQEYDLEKIKNDSKKYRNLTRRYRAGLVSRNELSIPSTDEFYVKELDSRSNEKPNDLFASKYELTDHVLDMMIDLLGELYPDYLEIVRSSSIPISFNPKEQFIKVDN